MGTYNIKYHFQFVGYFLKRILDLTLGKFLLSQKRKFNDDLIRSFHKILFFFIAQIKNSLLHNFPLILEFLLIILFNNLIANDYIILFAINDKLLISTKNYKIIIINSKSLHINIYNKCSNNYI